MFYGRLVLVIEYGRRILAFNQSVLRCVRSGSGEALLPDWDDDSHDIIPSCNLLGQVPALSLLPIYLSIEFGTMLLLLKNFLLLKVYICWMT